MKYTWTVNDLRCGRIVYVPPLEEKDRADVSPTRVHMLGYDATRSDRCLISICDGSIVLTRSTPASLVDHLNEQGYAPLPYLRYLKVLESLRDRIEGNA